MGEPGGPEGPFDTIAIVYSQDELGLITSRLEHEGIWVLRHSHGHVSAAWTLAWGLGGVRLIVRREQAQEAREVLGGLHPWEWHTGVYSDSRILDLLMALMLVLLAGVPPPCRIQSVLIPGYSEETA